MEPDSTFVDESIAPDLKTRETVTANVDLVIESEASSSDMDANESTMWAADNISAGDLEEPDSTFIDEPIEPDLKARETVTANVDQVVESEASSSSMHANESTMSAANNNFDGTVVEPDSTFVATQKAKNLT